MRTIIQRVSKASVTINNQLFSSVESGILILIGIEESDNQEDIDWLVKKITQLRIFDDQNGVMNLSLLDTGGEALIVSQFTLHASIKKGNRPSYIRAARPEISIPLYEKFVYCIENVLPGKVAKGSFGAMMEIALINNGPVTIILDSKNKDF